MRTSNKKPLFSASTYMLRRVVFLGCVSLAVVFLGPVLATAATIFESGTLGPTDITWEQITNQEVLGVNVSPAVFGGVRFQLTMPVVTTQVGGHFVARPNTDETFFGAVIRLDNENDFPDSLDLSTPDFVGAAILSFPEKSAEVFGDINVALDPGWYALIFGSGLFDAKGAGVALGNNVDIQNPAYFGRGPNLDWFELPDLSSDFVNLRFIVNGVIVPEPSTTVLAFSLLLMWLGRQPAFRSC